MGGPFKLKMLNFNSLIDALISNTDKQIGITFIESEENEEFLSYPELSKKAKLILSQLRAYGLKPGDELVFQFQSNKNFIITFWACLLGKIIPVPLTFTASGELKFINVWRVLQNPYLITDYPGFSRLLSSLEPGSKTSSIKNKVLFFDDLVQGNENEPEPTFPVEITPGDIAFIQFSSGSTGDPKGVVNTHRSLLNNMRDTAAVLQIADNDRFLNWMPLTHDLGMIFFHLLPLAANRPQFLLPTRLFIIRPSLWMLKASDHQATILGSPNFGFLHFLNHSREDTLRNCRFDGIKFIMNGAEPISAKTCEDFYLKLSKYGLPRNTLRPAYGLAEAALVVTLSPYWEEITEYYLDRDYLDISDSIQILDPGNPKAISFVEVGAPVGTVIKVTDDNNNQLPDNTVGHIKVKGGSVTPGYYNNPEETANTIDGQGWLNTGDLGFMSNGRLVFTGRRKDIIIAGGVNYYPHDIEGILAAIKGLETNKAAAASVPDESSGAEEVLVFVRFKTNPGRLQDFIPVVRQVKERILHKAGLIVHHVIPVNKIPKTTSGKLQRFKLAREYRKGAYNSIVEEIQQLEQQLYVPEEEKEKTRHLQKATRHEIQSFLLKAAAQLLGSQEVDMNKGLMDQGFTSLTTIRFQEVINRYFNLRFPISVIFDYPTISATADLIFAELNPGNKNRSAHPPQSEVLVLPNEPIAIIGMGCRFPGGADNPGLFWELLEKGGDAIGEIPPQRWEVDDYYHPDPSVPGKTVSRWAGLVCFDYIAGFDAHFFEIPPKEAAALDPQQRMLLEVSWEALEHAGISAAGLRGRQVGVYLGIGTDDYKGCHLWCGDLEKIDAYSASGTMFSSAGGRLSYFLGLQGPNISVDTACSSSGTALHTACQALRSRECEMALVGAVNALLSPNLFVYFSKLGVMSADGRCKTFDASANGYVRGEGCGVVVLKPLWAAQNQGDRVLAVIRGSALNQDGASSSFIAPNGTAQVRVMRLALANARVSPEDVDYIEAHGTGTPVGDPIELEALNAVYGQHHSREHPLWVGSVKTNIGHLEAAAGMAGLIKIILIMQKQAIPFQLHFSQPTPLVDWARMALKVNRELIPWKRGKEPRRAGLSSFGFSGTNSHLIIEEAPLKMEKSPSKHAPQRNTLTPYILTLSAKSSPALKALAQTYTQYFSSPGPALPDICYTANTGRSHFPYRLAVVAQTIEEIKSQLSGYAAEGEPEAALGTDQRIAFLFTGQGSQYQGMGGQLYESQPRFRRAVDQCDRLFRLHLDHSICEFLYPRRGESPHQSLVHRTDYSQPLIFSLQYALVMLWESWGITPSAVLGHSIGEFAAAVTAGIFKLEDAVKLVAERGRLMHSAPGKGVMAAVLADEKTVWAALKNHRDKAALASVNTPNNLVISGEEQAVRAVTRELKQKGIKSRLLEVSHAFHSPLMTPILGSFEKVTREVSYTVPPPDITYISGMTGKPAVNEVADAGYWTRHIVQPVRFSAALRLLADEGYEIFLEIGSNAALSSFAAQCAAAPGSVFLPSLRKVKGDWRQMMESLGQLYTRGINIHWQAVASSPVPAKVELPTYPFQRKTYWMNPGAVGVGKGSRDPARFADIPHDRMFYPLVWEEKPGKNIEQPGKIPPGTYLIFADTHPNLLAEHLERLLTHRGVPCVMVWQGEEYRHRGNTFTINPRKDWDRFFNQTGWERVTQLRILYLWGLNTNGSEVEDCPPGEIEKQQEEVCGSLLHIVNSVTRSFKETTLWIITRYVQVVGELSQLSLSLFQSTLWGMGKVIALEYPGTWGGLMDIDDGSPGLSAAKILEEIASGSREDRVAFRKEKRYVCRLEKGLPGPYTPSTPGEMKKKRLLDPRATYLVTGGTGGLGLVMAKWLKEKGARNIVLNSRKGLTPGVKEFLEKLNLEGHGNEKTGKGNIEVIKADVSDPGQVEELIRRISGTMPPLKGIIHAAGILNQRMMNEHDWDTFAKDLQPKVNGAWNVHVYTRHLPLDFFIMFSSIASLLGDVGQSSYAAANAFLDALASYRKILGLPGLSINWGPWDNTGMGNSRDSIKESLHKQGLKELKPQEAVTLMETLLHLPYSNSQIGIIDCNWKKYMDYSRFRGINPLYLEKLVNSRGQPRSGEGIFNKIKTAPPREGKALLTQLVHECAASVLGVESIQSPDPQVPLMDQGFDSLRAVEFRDLLGKKLDIPLPATLLFNYPTIVEVVVHIQGIMGLEAALPQSSVESKNRTNNEFSHLDNLSRDQLEKLISRELEAEI